MYDATGQKLRKLVKTAGVETSRQDYLGGIEIKNNRLEAIYNEEGCAYNTSNATQVYPYTWRYEYNLKDHLGNTRVVFCDKNKNGKIEDQTEILQETHYYPFGMAFNGSWYADNTASKNKYLYNGKELNEDFGLNLSDYGARWYDASIGRWWNVDPLAEALVNRNPYNYVSNNPVNATDPTGMIEEKGADGQTNSEWQKKSNPANHGSEAAWTGSKNTAATSENAENWAQTGQNRDVNPDDIAGTLKPFGYRIEDKNGNVLKDVVEGFNVIDGGSGDPKNYKPLSDFNKSLTFNQNFFATHIGLPLGVLELNRGPEYLRLSKLNRYDFMKPAYQQTILNPKLVGSLASQGRWAYGLSTFGKFAGRSFAVYGAVTTVSDYMVGRKSGYRASADLIMTGVGVWGGPYGLAACGIYFIGTTVYDYYNPVIEPIK